MPKIFIHVFRKCRKKFETPKVIAKNLKDIGIGLINPLVDILNYINIDLGQPMHAYDFDKLKGEISIRFSKKERNLKHLMEKNTNSEKKIS